MLDVNALFINICSSAVFLHLPRVLVVVTALYLCGHVSTIYRNVVRRNFSITKEAGAMAMWLLQHHVAFERLESATGGILSGCIAKEDVASSLHHLLDRRDCLDDEEIKQMTDFVLTEVTKGFKVQEKDERSVYDALMTAADSGLSNFWASLKESLGMMNHKIDHRNMQIDVDTFMSACSSSETISFNDLVKLFDGDRKIPILEDFFMPMRFKTSLAEIRGHKRNKGKKKNAAVRKTKSAESMDSMQHEFQREFEAEKEAIRSVQKGVADVHEEVAVVQEEVAKEQDEISMMTEKIISITMRLEELERKHEFAQFQCPQEQMSEVLHTMNTMTEQINVLMLRYDEQQRKHEFEQLQSLREIAGLKSQMALIDQTPGLKVMETKKAEHSITPDSCAEHVPHKPEHLLMADGRFQQYPKTRDVNCAALPRVPAHFHEVKAHSAASTKLCNPHSSKEACKEQQFNLPPTTYGQGSEFVSEPVLPEMMRTRKSRYRSRPKELDTSRHQSTNKEQEINSPMGWMNLVTSAPQTSPREHVAAL